MAIIHKINLNNYRNFKNYEVSFENNNVIYGLNGSGKTNILESISLLGKGRGFRNSSIEDLILNNKENFLVECLLENKNLKHEVKIFNKKNENKQKKISSIDDEISKEATNYLQNTITFLYFLPEMERLFVASPTYRRNFIDKLIFSENKNYNKLINKYKKNVSERSKILQLLDYDINWISTIEKEIALTGLEIYRLRSKQLDILNNELNDLNKLNDYSFDIKFIKQDKFYKVHMKIEEYLNYLIKSRNIDKHSGGTKIGPHKSDFIAEINNSINASQLSTGQQKTLVLMTLFAQCRYLIIKHKIKPILLFDEICSHLDNINRKILLDLTKQFDIQFFFTGTEKSLFSFMSTNTNFYNISK